MFERFLNKAAELVAQGEPFVTASVVRFEAPVSGKPGDKAIIFPDGRIWGWIGGGCAQPVVIKEALKALADGQPRLVRITPGAAPENGVVDYRMTCHSGGTLDIYIEPVLPKPHLLILGRSPVAQTLARLGKAIHYRVSVAAPGVDREQFPEVDQLQTNWNLEGTKISPETFVVVSTQGEDDEAALEQAVGTRAAYVAFVASKIKAEKIRDYLRETGLSSDRLSQIRAPAGLDINAASPEEIAVSVLAEIIQVGRSRMKVKAQAPKSPPLLNKEATDPVCGMLVETSGAKYISQYHGNSIYFCCAGCKQSFDRQPDKYMMSVSG